MDDYYEHIMARFAYDDKLGMPKNDHTECGSMIITNSVWLYFLMTPSACLELIILSATR